MSEKFWPIVMVILIVVSASWVQGDMLKIDDQLSSYYGDSEQIEVSNQTNHYSYVEFENRLINRRIVNGYVVETFQEFEIYKDEKGSLIKERPTNHINYIRYRN
ncbi:hypothetical protein LC087_02115 [Bacillus carboniphilus]|uniref:DUF3139 domain-containing protein n=1 Tax=Bacillus carboniphilus TaxID=86663 RepID=A0ABY9JXI4_9BACI|nr:hypothetical protein [Bacillus carboniphilus]WLR43038.1 hypothetical protein LC087_02115 [Bacillus carboniphilus]